MTDADLEAVFEPQLWPEIRIVGIAMSVLTVVGYTVLVRLASKRRKHRNSVIPPNDSDHPDTIRILQTRTVEVSSEEEAKQMDLDLSLSGSSDEEAPPVASAGGSNDGSGKGAMDPKIHTVASSPTFAALSQSMMMGSFEEGISL